MVCDRIIQAVRQTPKEFELILKVTTILAEYLHAEKVNFFVKGHTDPQFFGKTGVVVPIEVISENVASAWEIVGGPMALSDEQRSELSSAGYLLTLALENLLLRDRTIVDSLTRVFNRSYFDIRMREEIEKSRRYGNPFSLLMLDIDRFKLFNDAFGHQTGDEVLRMTAKALRDNLRSSDLVFRYGGEEFAIFLPNLSEKAASVVAERLIRHIHAAVSTAERLREKIKEFPLIKDGRKIPVSVSIGISTYSGVNKTLTVEDVVRRADESLYRAKAMGRDRSEVIGRSERLKILIVDDEKQFCEILKSYFTTRGYDVMTASSGQDALDLLSQHEFSIMFLDLRMPGVSGLDVLQRMPVLRKKMRILMLTAVHDEEAKRMMLEYGACEYLEKPVSIEYLNKHLMARVLEMRA